MKNLGYGIILLAFAVIFAVGCGKKKGAVDPDRATGMYGCRVGEVYSQEIGRCLVQANCNYGYGWYQPQNRCVPGIPVTQNGYYGQNGQYGYPNNQYGNQYGHGNNLIATFSPSNRSVYQNLLRDAGLCSRYDINFGSEKCKHYSKQGSIVLRVNGNGTNGSSATLEISAGKTPNHLYSNPAYAGYLPPNAGYAPAASVPIYIYGRLETDSQGLVFVGTNGAVDIYFNRTTLTNGVRMDIYYRGLPFASATGQRRPY